MRPLQLLLWLLFAFTYCVLSAPAFQEGNIDHAGTQLVLSLCKQHGFAPQANDGEMCASDCECSTGFCSFQGLNGRGKCLPLLSLGNGDISSHEDVEFDGESRSVIVKHSVVRDVEQKEESESESLVIRAFRKAVHRSFQYKPCPPSSTNNTTPNPPPGNTNSTTNSTMPTGPGTSNNQTNSTGTMPPPNNQTNSTIPPPMNGTGTVLPPSNNNQTNTTVPPPMGGSNTTLPPPNNQTNSTIPPSMNNTGTLLPPPNNQTNTTLPPSMNNTGTLLPPSNNQTNTSIITTPPMNNTGIGLPPNNQTNTTIITTPPLNSTGTMPPFNNQTNNTIIVTVPPNNQTNTSIISTSPMNNTGTVLPPYNNQTNTSIITTPPMNNTGTGLPSNNQTNSTIVTTPPMGSTGTSPPANNQTNTTVIVTLPPNPGTLPPNNQTNTSLSTGGNSSNQTVLTPGSMMLRKLWLKDPEDIVKEKDFTLRFRLDIHFPSSCCPISILQPSSPGYCLASNGTLVPSPSSPMSASPTFAGINIDIYLTCPRYRSATRTLASSRRRLALYKALVNEVLVVTCGSNTYTF